MSIIESDEEDGCLLMGMPDLPRSEKGSIQQSAMKLWVGALYFVV